MLNSFAGSVIPAVAIFVAASAAPAQTTATAKPMLAEPNPAPDGQTFAFSSGGDIWEAPAAGGVARLLVTGPATEARPIYSPDGSRLAFTSTRGGNANLFVLDLAGGAVRRLTWAEANEQLDGWSPDGRWLYFTTAATDINGTTNIMRVPAAGGTPADVSREAYLAEFHAAPSPDGRSLALIARGASAGQWWRRGSSHIDESELWLKSLDGGVYRPLRSEAARHSWPMWQPDGQALYYVSDAGGAQNLYRMGIDGSAPAKLTQFSDGRLLYPAIGRDSGSILFERDFAIWRLDLAGGSAAPLAVQLRGAPAGTAPRRVNIDNFARMALSPDGKKVALIGRGEIFITLAEDGGPAQRITTSAGAEREVVWSPDSNRLLYVSERGLDHLVAEYDVRLARETVLTDSGIASVPSYAPDGKSIAYVLNDKELHRLTLAAAKQPAVDRVLHRGSIATDGQFGPGLAWSPDGAWIGFPEIDRRSFVNVALVAAAGGEARPVSFLAHGQMSSIAWTGDGKAILFDTSQRSEQSRIVRVDLVPRQPPYQEDKLRDLFVEPKEPSGRETPTTPAAKKDGDSKGKADKPKPAPVRIEWAGLRARGTLLPIGLNAGTPQVSADGKTLIVTVNERGRVNYYSYSLDELAKEPAVAQPLTQTAGPKRDGAISADGKSFTYLDAGKLMTTPILSPSPKAVAVAAPMLVEFEREKMVAFDEAWSELNRNFYDPAFHGVDWQKARDHYRPFVLGAATPDEQWRAERLMVGELNASHLGIIAPPTGELAAPTNRVGNLALRFAESSGPGLLVREAIARGPGALAGIKSGDRLLRVDGEPIGEGVNLDSLLESKVGRRVTLSVASGGPARDVVVRPVGAQDAAQLTYRHWVEDRRALVDRLSNGRLGYVHLPDMGAGSLDQLFIDLDADNQGRDGVVVDIRNNNGGFINGYAIDVFARQNYLLMTPRDLFALPGRQALGQRALGKPTVLLTNESSLSDAEDFSEGYRKLGLGKIVGQPTSGWIIFTSNVPRIDGSLVRVPSVRIQTADGEDMERNPRPVDIAVVRPLGETLSGRDVQIETAVSTLLGQIGTRAAR